MCFHVSSEGILRWECPIAIWIRTSHRYAHFSQESRGCIDSNLKNSRTFYKSPEYSYQIWNLDKTEYDKWEVDLLSILSGSSSNTFSGADLSPLSSSTLLTRGKVFRVCRSDGLSESGVRSSSTRLFTLFVPASGVVDFWLLSIMKDSEIKNPLVRPSRLKNRDLLFLKD